MHALLIPLISLLLTLAPLPTDVQRPRVTGLYSNMRMSAETGDLGGEQLYITSSRSGFYALFQMAEGSPDVPVLVPLVVEGAIIKFEFPSDSKYARGLRSFEGTITATGLTGRFANGYQVTLPRLPC